jgi:two-component system CheB/CheR fusion protein
MSSTSEHETDWPRLIVGIGASAGGLDAARRLLAGMPTESGIAVVIVMHLDPTHESHIAELLRLATEMDVTQAADEQPIRPNSVYVIAPDRSLEIRGGVLLSTGPRAPHGARKPVDTFFASLALDQGERAVGVILSGTGNNGSSGLRDIEARGGLCLVQDPETAEYDGMPHSAIATGVAAYVVPPEEMPGILIQYLDDAAALSPPTATRRADPPETFHRILDLLSRTHGLDFRSSYKKATLERRAERRMALKRLSDWQAYLEVLQDDPAEVAALYRDLLIGVTEFFRDAEVWGHMETQLVPGLLAHRKDDATPLKIWVPGCASGEEPYSLAIVFLEQMERLGRSLKLQIFASDVSEGALSTARRGLYPSAIQETVSPGRLSRFFRRAGDSFEVIRGVRDSVTFTAHNLLADPPFCRLDLVSCRNLLIYLEPHAQQRAFQLFHFALKPGGMLLLGASETVGRPAHLFQTVSQKARIYRSTAVTEADRHYRLNWPVERAPYSARPGAAGLTPSGPRVSRNIEQIVLSRYTWACVAVTESFQIQSFFGPTHEYLMQPTGEVRMDLLAWARPGLYARLRTALEWVAQHKKRLHVPDMRVERHGTSHRVECTIEPITPLPGAGPLYLVGFRDVPHAAVDVAGASEAEAPLVRRLEAELKSLGEELQVSVEQLESSNEEYRASHEELLSLNEELQSSNEELESSKEELQSLNEEMVTINRQLEERNVELQLANTDLNNLLTSTHIPIIFLDRDLRVRRFTPAATELMRLVRSDVGRSVEHIKERFFDGGLIGDARRVLETLIPITAEVQTEDGRWYTRTVLPYRTEDDRIDGICIAFQDVTDRKKAAQDIDEARIFAQAIVATVRTALVVLDKDLHVASANDAFYQMFQVARSETEGFSLYELGDRQWDIPALRLLMVKVIEDELVTDFEVEHEFERIGWRVMRLDARLMRRIDRPPLILLAVEDWTERKAAARLAETRTEELIHEHRRKDEFLAMLGHELRNPLSALRHGLELLELASGESSPVKEIREMMTRQAIRIGSMLDQLLDIARLTAGKLQMAGDPVALDEAVQGAVEAVAPLIETRRQTLNVSMPPAGDVMVKGDLMRLTQVVENLLSNAARYTEEGGRIELVLESNDVDACLRVRDNGVGMDPEFVPHVFELFVQDSHSLARSSGGLGLGLALVKLAVEKHGGSVVASSPGRDQGSEFVVTLPRLQQPRPRARPAGAAPGVLPASRPRRILVVDDEADAAGALAELLARHGHEPRVAHSGAAALEAAQTFRPQVVLLDLGLPRMDGYEVARRLREQHPDEKITLVALTGYQKDDEQIEQAGFDRHMIKPPDMHMLFSWLAAWEAEG